MSQHVLHTSDLANNVAACTTHQWLNKQCRSMYYIPVT